jgi:hypothetical protein
MALNFPDAPTANQVFTVGNASWIWDTVKWVASTMSSPLPVVNGGTGANTPSGALSNLGGAPIVSPTFTGTVNAAALTTTGAVNLNGAPNNITGVTDGSNAAAGQVGEYISATQPTGQTLTSGAGLNLTSISLTAGDWNVDAVTTYNMSAGGTTYADTWINPPNTLVASAPGYAAVASSNGTLGGPITLNVAPTRLSITTTTTVNLTVRAAFTGPTVTAAGTIWARRVR